MECLLRVLEEYCVKNLISHFRSGVLVTQMGQSKDQLFLPINLDENAAGDLLQALHEDFLHARHDNYVC